MIVVVSTEFCGQTEILDCVVHKDKCHSGHLFSLRNCNNPLSSCIDHIMFCFVVHFLLVLGLPISNFHALKMCYQRVNFTYRINYLID